MIITSTIPGRIRIRDQRLTSTGQAEQIRTDLLTMHGVHDVTIASRTGSLLIIYTAATETMQQILAFLTTVFGNAEDSHIPAPATVQNCFRQLPACTRIRSIWA